MSRKPYFPMFVDLSGKKIVTVGGGTIAARRVKTLCTFAEDITVIAPDISEELQEMERFGQIRIVRRPVRLEDIESADLVLAATNDHALNERLYAHCRVKGICVNVASDKEKCDFFFPGICRQKDLVIGITASGTDHKAAAKMRRKIETMLQEGEMEKQNSRKKVVIGSRESALAVLQSRMVEEHIRTHYPQIETELLTMKTTGDKILDRTLDQVGGKGLFVKELDLALTDGRTQLSVHSLKDMPMEVPKNLPLVAFSAREDARDVLVLPEGAKELDKSKPLGCSSRRRTLQLKELYPDMEVKSIRGNLQTRLRKLDAGEYSALILAAAGLKRLGLEHRIARYFSVDEIIPAAGQGILAVQGRADQRYDYLTDYDDPASRAAAAAERAFVRFLDGGCSSPVAAYAEIDGQELFLRGLYYNEEDGRWMKGTICGKTEEAEQLGAALAGRLQKLCKKE